MVKNGQFSLRYHLQMNDLKMIRKSVGETCNPRDLEYSGLNQAQKTLV